MALNLSEFGFKMSIGLASRHPTIAGECWVTLSLTQPTAVNNP